MTTLTVYRQKTFERLPEETCDCVGVFGGLLDSQHLGEFANYSERMGQMLGQDLSLLTQEQQSAELDACEQVLAYAPVYSAGYCPDGHASLSINPDCGWPVVGFAVITEEIIQKHGFTVEPEDYQDEIQRHINLLNQAASGYVYGFVIRDSEGVEVDACWNFVGDNPTESGMLEQVPEELHPQIWKAFEDGQIELAPAQ